ncbi:hypothetical protein BDB01DRAFT_725431 [Pilobolus umbonatus]|nr:hypothetical protein BDB01DRAFT_725431 [Pilobolus umbonatus]
MPSPAQFHPSVTTYKESTKVLEEENQWSPPPQNTNAYQYSGTPYNNNDIQPATDIPITPIAPEKVDAEANVVLSEERHKPSKIRGLFRLILLVFSVGYLGFAAGASPFSGVPVPFDNQACFHFLYAVVSGFYIMNETV